MVAAKQSYRQKQTSQPEDVDAAWQRFEQKHYSQKRPSHRWMRVAAIFIAAAFLTGLSFAAYHAISQGQDDVAQTDSIYNVVPVNASFPGGDTKMFEYLQEHLRYPRPCQFFNLQGRVIVSFVVEKNGSITNIKNLHHVKGIKLTQKQVDDYNTAYPDNQEHLYVGQNISDLLDMETERVLKGMPKWNPAKNKDNKIVRSKFTMPVTFRLN